MGLSRFVGPDLHREAVRAERRHVSGGAVGRLWLIVGVVLVLLGIFGPMMSTGRGSSSSPASGSPQSDDAFWRAAPSEYGATPYSVPGDASRQQSQFGDIGLGWGETSALSPQKSGMAVDFSFVVLCLLFVLVCAIPSFWTFNPYNPHSSQYPPAVNFWAAKSQNLLGFGPSDDAAAFDAQDRRWGGHHTNGVRQVVDVRPGETRRHGLQDVRTSFAIQRLQSGGVEPENLFMPVGAQANSFSQGDAIGSWACPVPSSQAPGMMQSRGSSWARSLLGSASSLFGLGRSDSALPLESEVAETYMTYAAEMEPWKHSLARLIDMSLIVPLLQELEQMDRQWQDQLRSCGFTLSFEASRVGMQTLGDAKEVSVHDAHLPHPLSQDPNARRLWERRQQLETFLKHPSFSPNQRQYVLQRLFDWSQRGLAKGVRAPGAYGQNMVNQNSPELPTDIHILENLIMKMMGQDVDFEGCFWSASRHGGTPRAKHMEMPHHTWLRQVTDQNCFPKPAPHYEVVTQTKVWKLRPGPLNILEALAIFIREMHNSPRAYNHFNQQLRLAVESVSGVPDASGWRREGGLGLRGAGPAHPSFSPATSAMFGPSVLGLGIGGHLQGGNLPPGPTGMGMDALNMHGYGRSLGQNAAAPQFGRW